MGRAVSYSCDTCGVVVNIPGTQGVKGSSAAEHLRHLGWALSASGSHCQNCRHRAAPKGGRVPSKTMDLVRKALVHLDGVLDPEQLAALHTVVDRRAKSPRYEATPAPAPPAPAPTPPRVATKPAHRDYTGIDRHEIAAALNRLNPLQISRFCEIIRKMRGAPDDVGLINNGRDASHATLLAHAKREAKITDRSKPGTAAELLATYYGAKF